MRILLTNTTLCNFYGSQIFTYTLARELKRQGHQVACYAPKLGQVADLIRQADILATDDLRSIPFDIDVIHAHHRHESLLAFAAFVDKPMVMVCHGVLPWQEQPLKPRMNIVRYVAVSEEVRDHLVATHGVPPELVSIIRNGIETSRFYPKRPINPTPQSLLVLSNHSAAEQLDVIRRACAEKGITVTKVGFPDQNVWNVEDYINNADIVVTLGRGALEAAACKRVVIVFDYNGADGLVTKETFPVFRQRNFSGRTNRLQYTMLNFKHILDQYDTDIPNDVFEFIPEHDITFMAQQYVQVYKDAVEAFSVRDSKHLSNELFDGITEVIGDFAKEQTTLMGRLSELQRHEAETRRHLVEKTADVERLDNELQNVKEKFHQNEAEILVIKTTLLQRENFIADLGEDLRRVEEAAARERLQVQEELQRRDDERRGLEEKLHARERQIDELLHSKS